MTHRTSRDRAIASVRWILAMFFVARAESFLTVRPTARTRQTLMSPRGLWGDGDEPNGGCH